MPMIIIDFSGIYADAGPNRGVSVLEVRSWSIIENYFPNKFIEEIHFSLYQRLPILVISMELNVI